MSAAHTRLVSRLAVSALLPDERALLLFLASRADADGHVPLLIRDMGGALGWDYQRTCDAYAVLAVDGHLSVHGMDGCKVHPDLDRICRPARCPVCREWACDCAGGAS